MDDPLIVMVPTFELGKLENDFEATLFDKTSVAPVGTPVGLRSKPTGNLLAIGVVKSSTPGKAQVQITKRFS
jgi:hypothetical protein